jgi:ParB family transcriptional regulator, chromosome partitioning protein
MDYCNAGVEMAKRRSTAELIEAAHSAGIAIQVQDEAAAERAEVERTLPALMPFAKILSRVSDTRELRPEHVDELAESIAVLGLLEPLVVDRRGRLLAGGHRRAAIAQLQGADPEAFTQHFPDEMVPVRILNFDAEGDPDLALQVEVSENEKRRDYTVAEVRALAERLQQAGYTEVKGRPARGEKALRPALEVIIGKSLRTVRRYLNQDELESRTSVTLSKNAEQERAVASLRRLRTELLRWQVQNAEPLEEFVKLESEVVRLLKRVESTLKRVDPSR